MPNLLHPHTEDREGKEASTYPITALSDKGPAAMIPFTPHHFTKDQISNLPLISSQKKNTTLHKCTQGTHYQETPKGWDCNLGGRVLVYYA